MKKENVTSVFLLKNSNSTKFRNTIIFVDFKKIFRKISQWGGEIDQI